jgi:malonate transporter
MTAAIPTAFAPVFAMIFVGYLVRVTGWLPKEIWPGVNRLNYRLLLPCFVFAVLAQADFASANLIGLAVISTALSLALAGLTFMLARLFGFSVGATAPLVAVATLWNLVMFMALSTRLLGPEVYAASAAILAPGTIIGAAITVAAFARAQSGSTTLGLKRLALDPLVVAALGGLTFSLTGLAGLPLVTESVALIGASATAASLISMGAGLEFDKLKGHLAPLSLAAVMRAVVSPVLFLCVALALNLPAEHVVLFTLAGGVPGAAIAYAIGSEFDGDRPLTAGMLTASVPVCAVALPAFTALAISLTGLSL